MTTRTCVGCMRTRATTDCIVNVVGWHGILLRLLCMLARLGSDQLHAFCTIVSPVLRRAILSNDDLQPTAPWTSLLTNDFWGTPLVHSGSHKSFRPVCTATFRLNYLLGELNPYGYHLVNVALHTLATVLFLLLCLHLFGGKLAVSSFAALLFAVHPIHCEAVAGVVGRADVLACVFFLLASLCYFKACGSAIIPPVTAIQRHRPTYIAPLHTVVAWLCCTSVCAFLGMFSKESGITVLGVLVLYDTMVLSRAPLRSPWHILTEVGTTLCHPLLEDTYLYCCSCYHEVHCLHLYKYVLLCCMSPAGPVQPSKAPHTVGCHDSGCSVGTATPHHGPLTPRVCACRQPCSQQ